MHHKAVHSASLAVATIVAAAKHTQEEVHKIQGSLFTLDRQAEARDQKLGLIISDIKQKLEKLDQHPSSEHQGLA